MKTFALLILFMAVAFASFAQISTTLSRNYGGPGYDQMDRFYLSSDGGYYWCGYTKAAGGNIPVYFGYNDAWFMKVDANGDSVHSAVFGGSGSDYLRDVLTEDDINYVFLFESNSTDNGFAGGHGAMDVWIKGYNFTTGITPGLSFGGSGSDNAVRITPKTMGGFLVTGCSMSTDGNLSGNYGITDMWLMSLQANLTLAWSKHFGGSSYDAGIAAYQLNDGNILLFGNTQSLDNDIDDHIGGNDVWVVKLNSIGDIIWTKSYGGLGTDYITEVKRLSDTTFALIGASNSSDGDFFYRDRMSDFNGFFYVLDGNGTFVYGSALSTQDSEDILFTDACIDSSYYAMSFGVTMSNSMFNCTDINHGANDICVTDYHGYGSISSYLLGGSDDDGFNITGEKYVKAVKNSTDNYAFCTNSRSTSLSMDFHGDVDVWLNVFSCLHLSINESNTSQFIVYPNPANDFIKVENICSEDNWHYTIYDLQGKLVLQGNYNSNGINIGSIQSGIYLLKTNCDYSNRVARIMKQ